MSYLQDKKTQRKKILYAVYFVLGFSVLFYFRLNILSGLSLASHGVFRPVLVFGNNIVEKFADMGSFFTSKNSLYKENQDLKAKLDKQTLTMLNYSALRAENQYLKEILGRGGVEGDFVLATILGRPDQSLYDTFIIDIGLDEGVEEGDTVFGFSRLNLADHDDSQGSLSNLGNVPIGRVTDVYAHSSKVVLFSNAGEKTQVTITLDGSEIILDLIGRGGGNFEAILPRGFAIGDGSIVVTPGINPDVLGVVEATISDPRDSFTKVLLTSPINARQIKFVLVGR